MSAETVSKLEAEWLASKASAEAREQEALRRVALAYRALQHQAKLQAEAKAQAEAPAQRPLERGEMRVASRPPAPEPPPQAPPKPVRPPWLDAWGRPVAGFMTGHIPFGSIPDPIAMRNRK